jgi:hypothetical protein
VHFFGAVAARRAGRPEFYRSTAAATRLLIGATSWFIWIWVVFSEAIPQVSPGFSGI